MLHRLFINQQTDASFQYTNINKYVILRSSEYSGNDKIKIFLGSDRKQGDEMLLLT